MDSVWNSLVNGFSVGLQIQNLIACFAGVFLGQVVGVLPGIGPVAGMALLLPVTFGMDSTTAMIMLVGIYFGSKFGGAITSILINCPGDASSLMTTLDGYQMALKGRAGPALGLAAMSSFVGGTVGIIGITTLSPILANFALYFGPPEYTALVVMGLSMVVLLGRGALSKSLLAAFLGLLLGTIGIDPMSGMKRFVFGQTDLLDGIDFVIVAMGLYAISEVLLNLKESSSGVAEGKFGVKDVWPKLTDLIQCRWTFVRSSLIGFFVGLLPGGGATIASILSYGVERTVSKKPEAFGTGTPEGVAAGETADNAAVCGAMVPLLTLGIPGTGATAMLLGALIMYGVRPGPLLLQEQPALVWGLIASMYIGNLMLVALNLPGVPLFASIMRVPYSILYPCIIVFSILGVYVTRNSVFDIWLLVLLGLLGYVMKKTDIPAAPMILTFILGPILERALNQSMLMSHGSLAIFINRPIAATLLTITVVAYLAPLLIRLVKKTAARTIS